MVLLFSVACLFLAIFGTPSRQAELSLYASKSNVIIDPTAVSYARKVLKQHYLQREAMIYDVFGERETSCTGKSLPGKAAAPRKMDQKMGGQVWYLPFVTRADIPTLLNNLGLTGYGAEIGSLAGEGASHILAGWQGTKLVLVDRWDAVDIWSKEQGNSHFNTMLKRMEKFPGRYEIQKGWSHEVAAKYEDGFFDFIYTDAGHSYLDVRKDLIAWWPKLKSGGLFAGHDYYNGRNGDYYNGDYVYGVRDAVDEFAEVFHQRVYSTSDSMTGTGDIQSWYMVKC
jgi:hypothetical protein